jgi:aryl-alcohol dehydrogenase-like predicted oxidoreductase
MAAVSLAWCLHQPGITAVLAGARNAKQVEENLHAAELRLDDETVAALSAATEPVKSHMGANPDMLFSAEKGRLR